MKIKGLLLIGAFWMNTSFSQVSDVNEFLKFTTWSQQERSLYLVANGWSEDGYKKQEYNRAELYYSEELTYLKDGYAITLTSTKDLSDNVTITIVKVVMKDEEIYNKWVKELTKMGCKFKKAPEEEEDAYTSILENGTVLEIEKKEAEEDVVFSLSVSEIH